MRVVIDLLVYCSESRLVCWFGMLWVFRIGLPGSDLLAAFGVFGLVMSVLLGGIVGVFRFGVCCFGLWAGVFLLVRWAIVAGLRFCFCSLMLCYFGFCLLVGCWC